MESFLKKLILELSLEGLIIVNEQRSIRQSRKENERKAERHGTHGDL